MPASVRLKLFSSELHWLWHNCALSLVYASVNEVLVLLCQLLCRLGSEWWRWYLRAGKECRCNLLIVCQKSYIFLPWTVNWAALMVLVLLEHSPKGAPGSVLCSALGCSLRISHTFLLQGSSGKLISFRPESRAPARFPVLLQKDLWKRNRSIVGACCQPLRQLIWGFWSKPACLHPSSHAEVDGSRAFFLAESGKTATPEKEKK